MFSLPIAGTFISVTLANNACVLLYARMGVNDFAAITLISPWVAVVGTIGMAWAQSTGVFIAQLLGANTASADVDAFLGRAWRWAFVGAGMVSGVYLFVYLGSGWLFKVPATALFVLNLDLSVFWVFGLFFSKNW